MFTVHCFRNCVAFIKLLHVLGCAYTSHTKRSTAKRIFKHTHTVPITYTVLCMSIKIRIHTSFTHVISIYLCENVCECTYWLMNEWTYHYYVCASASFSKNPPSYTRYFHGIAHIGSFRTLTFCNKMYTYQRHQPDWKFLLATVIK